MRAIRTREGVPAELRRALEQLLGASVDEVVLREHSMFARLHRGARATTRRNAIYLRGSLEEFLRDPELVLHEYYHVLRQWNRGRMTIWRYLLECGRHGYWQNRYERHARRFAATRLARFRHAVAGSAAAYAPLRRFNLLRTGADPEFRKKGD